MKYDTSQKKELLAIFTNNKDKAFSAEELASLLPNMAQSSLYRVLSKMVESGSVRKLPSENRICLYQYSDSDQCPHHMHIRCIKCGSVEHLSNDASEKIKQLIKTEDGFYVSVSSTLEGLCSKCQGK